MSRIFSRALLCFLTFALFSCDKVPLTAPTGSTMTLTVNTTALPLEGTAQLTAVVKEASDTAPQNGTTVTFTTDLGSVEPVEARTTNGIATATFRAGSSSGVAHIGAVSGGATAPAVTVNIGGLAVQAISLSSEPGPAAGTVTVVATITDVGGNPLRGVTVTFTSDNGQLSPASVPTDVNGQARTTVTPSGVTIVIARIGAVTAQITIQAPNVTLAVTTTAPEVGTAVNFTVTPAASAALRSVVIDFGDGSTQNLGPISGVQSFSHIYSRPGTYTVKATATTPQGLTSTSSIIVAVNDEAPLVVSLSAGTASLSLGGVASLTASAAFPAGSALKSVSWDFGDGQDAETTSLSIAHVYRAVGVYSVSVTVESTNGREGTASSVVTITP